MRKYTSGPWQVNKKVKTLVETVEGGQGINLIADCLYFTEEDEANARLIAAAPCLLEALEIAQEIVKIWCKNNPTKLRLSNPYQKISLAITKAKGES